MREQVSVEMVQIAKALMYASCPSKDWHEWKSLCAYVFIDIAEACTLVAFGKSIWECIPSFFLMDYLWCYFETFNEG